MIFLFINKMISITHNMKTLYEKKIGKKAKILRENQVLVILNTNI